MLHNSNSHHANNNAPAKAGAASNSPRLPTESPHTLTGKIPNQSTTSETLAPESASYTPQARLSRGFPRQGVAIHAKQGQHRGRLITRGIAETSTGNRRRWGKRRRSQEWSRGRNCRLQGMQSTHVHQSAALRPSAGKRRPPVWRWRWRVAIVWQDAQCNAGWSRALADDLNAVVPRLEGTCSDCPAYACGCFSFVLRTSPTCVYNT